MKGFKKSLLWITCFQFVSMVRTEQGIEDGQVHKVLLEESYNRLMMMIGSIASV